jgi:hypothetical protein
MENVLPIAENLPKTYLGYFLGPRDMMSPLCYLSELIDSAKTHAPKGQLNE